MTRALLSLALLVLVYAMTLGSFHPWDLLAGAVFSAAVLAGFRRFLFPAPPLPARVLLQRVAAFPAFVAAVFADVARGTWAVTLLASRLRPLNRPGIVAVPLGERTPLGISVTALVVTLSPGSFLVDVDEERGVFWFHVLDASDPERVRRLYAAFYERQRRVFP